MNKNSDKDRILYFPSINPPSGLWLNSALIYYDEVNILMPVRAEYEKQSGLNHDNLKSEYTQRLIDYGFVRPVESIEDSRDRRILENALAPIITIAKERKEEFLRELYTNPFRIYPGKINYSIFSKLQELDLVIDDPDPNKYYHREYLIPSSIGYAIMYKLAYTIGELDYCTPSTDDKEFRFELVERDNVLLKTQYYSKFVLEKILPIPNDDSLDRVLLLKERYREPLINFRRLIESKMKRLAFIEDKDIEEYLIEELKEIQDRISMLTELYNEVGIDKLSMHDIMNAYKVVSGGIMGRAGTVFAGLFGFAKGKSLPMRNDPITFPAIMNYHLN